MVMNDLKQLVFSDFPHSALKFEKNTTGVLYVLNSAFICTAECHNPFSNERSMWHSALSLPAEYRTSSGSALKLIEECHRLRKRFTTLKRTADCHNPPYTFECGMWH
jgi:hypothetical protein